MTDASPSKTTPPTPTTNTIALTAAETPGRRLRWLMDQACVACPGAFNGLVARAVKDAGFDACYLSGGATSAAAGVPDIGLLTQDRFCQTIREVADASGLPVLADADTGFGEEQMTRQTVVRYAQSGAAGLHIEDQVFPKRCGHLEGKELIPQQLATDKVRWAAETRDERGDGFVICARTDARSVDGLDAAIDRATGYAEAGADMIFPEGLTSEDEFARFAEALGAMGDDRPYLLANMTEFGKTPSIPVSRFEAMGYSIVIFPVSTLRLAMKAVTDALAELKATGDAAGLISKMQTRDELYALLGYNPAEPWKVPVS